MCSNIYTDPLPYLSFDKALEFLTAESPVGGNKCGGHKHPEDAEINKWTDPLIIEAKNQCWE